MKKINRCKDGGWVKFYQKLATDESGTFQPECQACKSILEQSTFKAQDLLDAIEQALGEEGVVVAQEPGEEKEAAAADAAGKLLERMPLPKKKRMNWSKDPGALQGRVEDALQVAKEYEPHIVLLPRGSHNRKFPYRCKICVSKAQPEGTVGDLTEMRPSSVRHFLGQHLKSQRHQEALKALNPVEEIQRTRVPCEALFLGDEMPGSLLHCFKHEFSIWASFANLEATAKHQYWKDASEGHWRIRSNHCLKEVEENPLKFRHIGVVKFILYQENEMDRIGRGWTYRYNST